MKCLVFSFFGFVVVVVCLLVCPFLSFGFVVVVLFCFTAYSNFTESTRCAVCLLRRNKLPILAIICYVEPPLKQNNWSVIHNRIAGMPQSINVVLIYSNSKLGNFLEKWRDVQESVNYFHKTSTCGISLAGAATSITFVATNTRLSRQTRLLSRQKYACRDKTFVATKLCLPGKIILVVAPANNSGRFIHWSTSIPHALIFTPTLHRVQDMWETCLMCVMITSVGSITYEWNNSGTEVMKLMPPDGKALP